MNKESFFHIYIITNYSFIKNSLLFTGSERFNSLLDLKKNPVLKTKENVVYRWQVGMQVFKDDRKQT
jgi:hypothetical protein